MRKFTNEPNTYLVRGHVCRWKIQKMQSESNEYLRETSVFFADTGSINIALESYFDEHVKEGREINSMNSEVQTALLTTYPPKVTATILKALRE